MAVTVTYSLKFVKNLDLAQGPATDHPDATSLTGGGFAVSGSFVTDTALEVFNPLANSIGGTAAIDGIFSTIDQLSNGNIAVLTNSFDPIFTVTTAAGVPIGSSGVPGQNVAFQHDVAALSGGGFWVVVFDRELQFNSGEIFVDFGTNNGSFTGGFNATASIGADAFDPSAAGLDNGKVALAWKDSLGNITYAVYDSLGGVIKAPALAGTTSLLSHPSLTATAKGFALAYTDSSWGTGGSDITLKQFRFDGSLLLTSNVSNPGLSTLGNKETQPSVARLSNDLLAVAYNANIPPIDRTDPVVIDTHVAVVDPATGNRLAGRNVLGGEPATDEVETPTVTGFANGGVAVFHRNITDNDVDGEHLQAKRTSTGDALANSITGDSLIDDMSGGGGNDTLRGFAGTDTLRGGIGNDFLVGGDNNDRLFGQAGSDVLTGGPGTDNLAGGSGPDRFDFNSVAESGLTAATRDRISDFTHLIDDLDFTAIDAKAGTPFNNAFSFRGTLAFDAEGQVRVVQSGAHTLVYLNTTGLTGAEMILQLDNVTATSITAADFFM